MHRAARSSALNHCFKNQEDIPAVRFALSSHRESLTVIPPEMNITPYL
jgi:hypothetical protein